MGGELPEHPTLVRPSFGARTGRRVRPRWSWPAGSKSGGLGGHPQSWSGDRRRGNAHGRQETRAGGGFAATRWSTTFTARELPVPLGAVAAGQDVRSAVPRRAVAVVDEGVCGGDLLARSTAGRRWAEGPTTVPTWCLPGRAVRYGLPRSSRWSPVKTLIGKPVRRGRGRQNARKTPSLPGRGLRSWSPVSRVSARLQEPAAEGTLPPCGDRGRWRRGRAGSFFATPDQGGPTHMHRSSPPVRSAIGRGHLRAAACVCSTKTMARASTRAEPGWLREALTEPRPAMGIASRSAEG